MRHVNDPRFGIRLLASAEHQLRGLDPRAAEQVATRLTWLAEHADEVQHRALTGALRGQYKLRCGSYRVFYEVLSRERLIIVHAIGDRRDVYRRR